MKYKLEYADGYYIEKDGEGFLDFAEDVSGEEAQSVVDVLNTESKTIAKLRGAFTIIYEGKAMAGKKNFTHVDVIQEYYKIARAILEETK